MPIIEGLGDEVTLVLGGFLICIVLILAWFSTHTADIPLLREVGVIVVELSQRRSRTRNTNNGDGSEATNDSNEPPTPENDRQGDSMDISSRDNVAREETENETTERNGATAAKENQPTRTSVSSRDDGIRIGIRTSDDDLSSPGMLLQAAEAITSDINRETSDADSEHLDQSQQNKTESTDRLIPQASVVAGETNRFTHSQGERACEEEIRRRRVEYFHTSHLLSSSGTDGLSNNSTESQSLVNQNIDVGDSSLSRTLPENTVNHLSDSSGRNVPSNNGNNSRLFSHENEASVNTGKNASDLQQQEADVDPVSGEDSFVPENDSGVSRIRVKLKYMNETQRLVYASPFDTIGDFRRTHFQPELEENKWVRFIYNGQDLRDDARTLQACNVSDNCTMHCLITTQNRQAPSREAMQEDEDDSFMGAMMYPLFTLVLLVVWYFRLTYRQYFSAMSTVCLIGISFLLALSYVSSLRMGDRDQAQQQQPAGGAVTRDRRENHPHAD